MMKKTFTVMYNLLSKFLIIKINLDITQNKENYSKSNIYINLSQQEIFLKKLGFSIFIIY